MKDLQTVLDALELAERTSYSESNQDKFIESIAIVKQMMHAEPVGGVDIQRHCDYMAGFNEGYERATRFSAQQAEQLRNEIWVKGLLDAAQNSIGCFKAAVFEGLSEALAETTDARLKDLVERRLLYVPVYLSSAITGKAAPKGGAL